MRDFVSDPNPVGINCRLDSFPAWMDTVEFPSQEEVQGLHKAAFADPDRRLHPVHTKAACILTAAYLTGLSDVPVFIKQNTARAAAVLGVEDEVNAILAEVKQASEDESTCHDDAYALVEGEQKFYPVGTTFDIELSTKGWREDVMSNKLLLQHARKAACALRKRASEEEVTIDPMVLDYSNEDPPNCELIAKQARARGLLQATASDREEVEGMYMDVVKTYEAHPSEEQRVKAAAVFAHLDRHLRVQPVGSIIAPQVLWLGGASVEKKASAQGLVLRGEELPLIALSSVPISSLTPHFINTNAELVKAAHTAASAGRGEEATSKLAELSESAGQRLAQLLIQHHSR